MSCVRPYTREARLHVYTTMEGAGLIPRELWPPTAGVPAFKYSPTPATIRPTSAATTRLKFTFW